MTAKLLKQYILESLDELFKGFNLQKFKELQTINQKLLYAKKNLRPNRSLGTGSARTAFAISSSKVLKIAMNNKGFAQNNAEVEMFLLLDSEGYGDIVTKIFDYDAEKKSWVIAEIVREATPEDFSSKAGIDPVIFFSAIDDIDCDLPDYLEKSENPKEIIKILAKQYMKSLNRKFNGKYKELENLYNNGNHLLEGAIIAMSKGDLIGADLQFMSHYGVTANGKVVILDYGYTEEVYIKHY